MTGDPGHLDADVLAALRGAMPLVTPAEAAKARILAAVEGRILALPGPGPGPGPGKSPTGPAGPGAARGPVGTWLSAHPWIGLGTALLVGGAVGAALRGPSERVVYVDRGAPPAAPASPEAHETELAAPAPSAVPVESLPRAAVTASAAPSPIAKEETDDGEALAAESAILDVARSGIARGEPEPALEAVGRHQRRFPHGLLTEEREALAIRALLLAARDDEAHARASRFRAAYPGSMFWPSLEAKLDGGK